MKKNLFLLVTMVMSLVSCTDQQFVDETLANKALLPMENEFNALIEQARWGDGQAFLKLADCYRDGKGVEKDFVGMLSMAAQADEFGGVRRMEDYLKEMPEGSDYMTKPTQFGEEPYFTKEKLLQKRKRQGSPIKVSLSHYSLRDYRRTFPREQ